MIQLPHRLVMMTKLTALADLPIQGRILSRMARRITVLSLHAAARRAEDLGAGAQRA